MLISFLTIKQTDAANVMIQVRIVGTALSIPSQLLSVLVSDEKEDHTIHLHNYSILC